VLLTEHQEARTRFSAPLQESNIMRSQSCPLLSPDQITKSMLVKTPINNTNLTFHYLITTCMECSGSKVHKQESPFVAFGAYARLACAQAHSFYDVV
jgi:hypothetical protein